MKKQAAIALAGALLIGIAAGAQTEPDPEATDARKAKIVANLQLQFPQLADATVTVTTLTDSPYAGLDQGTLTVNFQQTQAFLVSEDDTELYLVAAGPIDVSLASAEVEAELESRRAGAAREAEERAEQLAEAIDGLPAKGPENAPVTIVEFSDFQCPFCARTMGTVEQLLRRYPEDVKIVYAHFPLTQIHPWAMPAAIAATCAADQDHDAFWQLHDAYFERQGEIDQGNVIDKSAEILDESGIDLTAWRACAADESSTAYQQARTRVQEQLALGGRMGVTGTPGFFVEGSFLNGAQPIDAFVPLIEQELDATR